LLFRTDRYRLPTTFWTPTEASGLIGLRKIKEPEMSWNREGEIAEVTEKLDKKQDVSALKFDEISGQMTNADVLEEWPGKSDSAQGIAD
jgi:hypothetical protein